MKQAETKIHDLRDLPSLLSRFVLDPIGSMRNSISMTWPAIFALQAGLAMISGAVLGLINRSFLDFLAGLLVFPIASVAVSLIFSLFIYYYFSFMHSTFLEFRRLHSITTLAMMPYFALHLVSGFLPPLDLLGFAVAGLLIVVGLVEQFGLERKIVAKLILGLGCAFAIAWSVAQYRAIKRDEVSSPKALDEMQSEVAP